VDWLLFAESFGWIYERRKDAPAPSWRLTCRTSVIVQVLKVAPLPVSQGRAVAPSKYISRY